MSAGGLALPEAEKAADCMSALPKAPFVADREYTVNTCCPLALWPLPAPRCGEMKAGVGVPPGDGRCR